MSIEVKNLFYTYLKKTPQAKTALNGVNVSIAEHSFTAILGETGCGKSTLIQNFNALLVPDSGEVVVDEFLVNHKIKKQKKIKQLRKHLGIVFQFPEYQLFEQTVEKDVAFGLINFGCKQDEAIEKAHEAILAVGLDESFFKRSPFSLSGGEKRRVAIAGMLAINPDILVLDEPTAGLDPHGVKEIMGLVDKMHKDGHTIVLVTHDMGVVEQYCDDAIVLKEGKVIFHDSPKKLFSINSEEFSIESTQLFNLLNKLMEKGFKLDYENINNIDDLVKQIKEQKR